MSLTEPEKPKKRYKSGKSGKPFRADRLPGLDLRTEAGQIYRRAFRDLSRQFPNAPASDLRELAAFYVQRDTCHAEALAVGGDSWQRAKAREQAIALSRLLERRLAVLRGAHPPSEEADPAEPAAPSLASILAKHAEAAE
jgi:hypothetical protein